MLTIYKASAGSGKTHQLTLEYVKLLLGIKIENSNPPQYRLNNRAPIEHNRHRGILAITFTNKATEEMKTRIINELVKISESTDADQKSKFVPDLTKKIFGCSVAELAVVAKRALYDLLLDFDNFNVSTIDAFFQQVLRSLAYELDYPGNYEVVIQSDGVTSQAVDMMLDDFNFNPERKGAKQLKGMLLEFMREQCRNGEPFNVFNRNLKLHSTIVGKVASLFNEKYQIVSKVLDKWFANCDDSRNLSTYFRAIRADIESIVEQNKADVQSIIDFLDTNYPNDQRANFVKLINQMADPKLFIAKQYKSSGEHKNVDAILAGLTVAEVLKGKAVKTADPAQFADIAQKAQEMLQRIHRYVDDHVLIDEISTYSFMRYTNFYIEQIRKDNNIVVLADTNDMLKRVMSDDGEISFVYEKMGMNLHNFLIDEFQDTSLMQWSNLKELVYNGLSEGNDSLIIGDEKQAIYRFRNSDSSMLHSTVRDETLMREADLDEKFSDMNWRSSPEVIMFNNSFFSRMSNHLGIAGYNTVVQGVSENKLDVPGYVHFFNAPRKVADVATESEDETEIEGEVEVNTDAESDEAATQAEPKDQLDLLYEQIMRQIESGYLPGEITVLVDTASDGAKVVDRLMEYGLDVTTSDALLLRNSQSVRLIVSIMQLVVNAKERQINEKIYDEHHTPRKKYSSVPEKLGRFEYAYTRNILSGANENDAISEAIDETFANVDVDEAISDVADIAAINPSTIHTLVEAIIEKRIPPEQRRHDRAYLAAFQDVVLAYAATYGNNVVGFLQWWAASSYKLTINTPSETQAINIMTVHKSKGLEFACVHIPFASWELEGNKKKFESVWVKKSDFAELSNFPSAIYDTMPDAIRVTLNKRTGFDLSIFKRLYDANMRERRVDGFNKTYVAYTRAERELCVYYDAAEAFGRDIALVHTYPDDEQCAQKPDLLLNLEEYVQPNGDIIVGSPTTPVRENKKDAAEPEHDEDFITPDDLIADYPTNVNGQGTSVTTVEALIGEDDDNTDDIATIRAKQKMAIAAERGERLHYILSRISRLEDMERAFRPTFFYKFSQQDKEDIRRMLSNPHIKEYVDRWFRDQDRAICEINIFDPNAPEMQSSVQRPDRIVWNKDGSIDIIDYKFTGETRDEHNTQVHRYMNLLRLIYPDKTINGYIWYADHDIDSVHGHIVKA